MGEPASRRELRLQNLDDVIVECNRLSRRGYVRNGNWSLGQICRHIRLTIEANMDGYPWWMTALGYPLRPILRWIMLPRLMDGRSPAGISTAPMFVPPDELEDREEVAALTQCVARFCEHEQPLYPHPGFGSMSKERFNRFHASHAAHHLSFLEPVGSDN